MAISLSIASQTVAKEGLFISPLDDVVAVHDQDDGVVAPSLVAGGNLKLYIAARNVAQEILCINQLDDVNDSDHGVVAPSLVARESASILFVQA